MINVQIPDQARNDQDVILDLIQDLMGIKQRIENEQ